MVMPSSVAHVRRSLKKTLSILLDKEEIMSELLKEYEPEIAKDFIKTYVNLYQDGKRIKDGKEMNVITTLPQESVDLDATFFIDMGEGSEDEQAIGNLINVYENDGDGTANIERLTPVIDTAAGTVVLTTSALIGDLFAKPNAEMNTLSPLSYTPKSNNVTQVGYKTKSGKVRNNYIMFRTVSSKSEPSSWILNRNNLNEDNTSKRLQDDINALINNRMRQIAKLNS